MSSNWQLLKFLDGTDIPYDFLICEGVQNVINKYMDIAVRWNVLFWNYSMKASVGHISNAICIVSCLQHVNLEWRSRKDKLFQSTIDNNKFISIGGAPSSSIYVYRFKVCKKLQKLCTILTPTGNVCIVDTRHFKSSTNTSNSTPDMISLPYSYRHALLACGPFKWKKSDNIVELLKPGKRGDKKQKRDLCKRCEPFYGLRETHFG